MASVVFLVHRLRYFREPGIDVRAVHSLRRLTAGRCGFAGTFVAAAADQAHVDAVGARCPGSRIDRRRAAQGARR